MDYNFDLAASSLGPSESQRRLLKEPFREVSVNIPVRMADANSQIPIIFVTAHGDASVCDLVMKAGASGFLNKPVRSDALLKEIQAALENAAKGRQPG